MACCNPIARSKMLEKPESAIGWSLVRQSPCPHWDDSGCPHPLVITLVGWDPTCGDYRASDGPSRSLWLLHTELERGIWRVSLTTQAEMELFAQPAMPPDVAVAAPVREEICFKCMRSFTEHAAFLGHPCLQAWPIGSRWDALGDGSLILTIQDVLAQSCDFMLIHENGGTAMRRGGAKRWRPYIDGDDCICPDDDEPGHLDRCPLYQAPAAAICTCLKKSCRSCCQQALADLEVFNATRPYDAGNRRRPRAFPEAGESHVGGSYSPDWMVGGLLDWRR